MNLTRFKNRLSGVFCLYGILLALCAESTGADRPITNSIPRLNPYQAWYSNYVVRYNAQLKHVTELSARMDKIKKLRQAASDAGRDTHALYAEQHAAEEKAITASKALLTLESTRLTFELKNPVATNWTPRQFRGR